MDTDMHHTIFILFICVLLLGGTNPFILETKPKASCLNLPDITRYAVLNLALINGIYILEEIIRNNCLSFYTYMYGIFCK